MAAANAASEVFAEAKEQVSDLVAEAKAEQAGKTPRSSSSSSSRSMHS